MSTKLDLSQQQQLRQRLSPRQVKFGRVLEMSAPEFEDEVKRMLDENPALEEIVPHDAPAKEKDDEGIDFTETAEEMQRADYSDPDDIPSYRLNISNHSADDDYYEPIAVDESESGAAMLVSQLADYEIDEREREIAIYIIGNIDENGYLTRSVADMAYDIAVALGIDVTDDEVGHALKLVRSLDPAGIGAFNLQECLLLQLERLSSSPAVDHARTIISSRYDLFAKKHFERIKTACKLSDDEFKAAMRVITSLNPKPGSILEPVGSADRLRHITPDFTIDVSPDGEITIALAGRIPELGIEHSFSLDQMAEPTNRRQADAQTFIRARRDEATEFIELAKMRSTTLMSVIEAIVHLQPEYFRTFEQSKLRPMVLRDVRRLTGLDLSVISRATAGKFAMTPHGIISLKSLFSESTRSDEDTSVHAVSEAIRAVIEAEDKRHPLSDAGICDALKRRGIDIARRTVAKYRERMGFPVGRLRGEVENS